MVGKRRQQVLLTALIRSVEVDFYCLIRVYLEFSRTTSNVEHFFLETSTSG